MIKNHQLIEQRRQQIVEGAVRLFIEKGFHKTTTREIARECGLSIGTMYEYIKTKEDVLYLVCQDIHRKMEQGLLEAYSPQDPPVEALKKMIPRFFQVIQEMRPYILLIYQETKSLPKPLRDLVLQKEEEIAAIFERILQKGIETGDFQLSKEDIPLVAHNIMVLGEMWAFRFWAMKKKYSFEDYCNRQIHWLISQITIKE